MKKKDAVLATVLEPTDIVVDQIAFKSLAMIPFGARAKKVAQRISNIARVIEAFVFYNRVIIFSYPARSDDEIIYYPTHQQYALASLANIALSENALIFAAPGGSLEKVPHPIKIIKQAIKLGAKLTLNLKDQEIVNSLEYGYEIYQQELARQAQIPFLPAEESSLIKSYMPESHKARIDLCRNLVSSLDSATKNDIETLQQIGVPIKFYIPPLLSLVLEKVAKGAEFGEAVWDVREKFRQVRSLISTYGILLQDTSHSLKDFLEARRKIFRDIELLSKSFEHIDRTGFKEWADVLDTIPDILKDVAMGSIPKATVIAKLLALPIEQLRSIILKRRYSSLFKARRDFYNITDYSNLLDKAMLPYQRKWERVYGMELGIYDLSNVRSK